MIIVRHHDRQRTHPTQTLLVVRIRDKAVGRTHPFHHSLCQISFSFPRLFDCITMRCKQEVSLTGRNRTGPPWSVGRPTAHAPGSRSAGSVTDDDRRQRAIQYWPIRRASNNAGRYAMKHRIVRN